MSDSATVPGTRPSSDLDRIRWATTDLAVEIPSWGFVNTGTRFRVFPQPGVPRDAVREDRGRGHGRPLHGHRQDGRPAHPVGRGRRLRGHWRRSRRERGIRIGGINSNTFQDEDYKLGSLCHPDGRVRRKAIDAIVGCCEIARADRLRHRQGVAVRRDELPGPGRLPRTPAAPDRRADRGLRGAPRDARGWCSSTSSTSRRSITPTCRTGASRCRSASTSASGRRSASTPAITRWVSTSSRSSRSCSRRAASARST